MSFLLPQRDPARSLRYELAFPAYARLPWPLAYRLADGQSKIYYHRRKIQREIMRQQMQTVFPVAAPVRLDQWLHDFFRMVEQEALDTWFYNQKAATTLTTLQGFDVVREARQQGRRVILTSGHFGRFWMAGPAMKAQGFTTGTITRDGGQENMHGLHPAEHRYRLFKLKILAQVLGGPFLIEGGDLRSLYRSLDNHLITLVFDVPYPETQPGSVTVPFLGGKIAIPGGVYRIAKKTGSLVAPFFMCDGGKGKVVAEFTGLLEPDNYNVGDFMSLLAGHLETRILSAPGQWWLWEALPLLQRE
ncbi:MAG: lipid A biosynthesis acyltransferase [Thiothrix sp.]|nr:lipid A biosynthesis acyltransferase [Thiothrix sp.]HPQ94878.1 lipid A biosynthesis acyltransferase [Thiolinea sp.]